VVCNVTIFAVGFRLSIRAYQMLGHSNGVLQPQKSAFNIILHAHVEFLLLIYCRFNTIISYLMRISLLMNKADLRFHYFVTMVIFHNRVLKRIFGQDFYWKSGENCARYSQTRL
jgi:hypothetical protein